MVYESSLRTVSFIILLLNQIIVSACTYLIYFPRIDNQSPSHDSSRTNEFTHNGNSWGIEREKVCVDERRKCEKKMRSNIEERQMEIERGIEIDIERHI